MSGAKGQGLPNEIHFLPQNMHLFSIANLEDDINFFLGLRLSSAGHPRQSKLRPSRK